MILASFSIHFNIQHSAFRIAPFSQLCHRRLMDRRETERILHAIGEARRSGERVAIAMVVRVKGSAYRREGTRILVRQDGTYECLLSGGCLEPAVADAAARVIATGEPAIVSYDLEEDSIWGLGIGCSGAVDIRIERLEDDPITMAWLDLLARGDAAALITPLSGATGRLLVGEAGEILGGFDVPNLEAAARPRRGSGYALRIRMQAQRPSAVRSSFSKSACRRRRVFGAGYDAAPLAAAGHLDSPSRSSTSARRFSPRNGSRMRRSFRPLQSVSRAALTLDARSFVVVMNHHLERDRESLRFALASDAPYIGLLGPRSRYRKLVSALAGRGSRTGCGRTRPRAKSHWARAWRRNARRDRAVDPGGNRRDPPGLRGRFPERARGSLHWPSDNRAFARS